MNASTLLRDLRYRGVTVEAQGGKLIVDGPVSVLTDDITALVQARKRELLRLVGESQQERCRDPESWHAYFDERAAIRQYDGGYGRREAEHLALEDTIAHWLQINPPHASDQHCGCIHCGRPEQAGNPLIAYPVQEGYAWVHNWCWRLWINALRNEAADTLLSMGISSRHDRSTRPGMPAGSLPLRNNV